MRIAFYYDYGCPWAYLGSSRLEAYFKDCNVEIDFHPMLLSIVREPAPEAAPAGARGPEVRGPEVRGPGMGPRKLRNAANDLRHWADLCGAEFSPNARSIRPDSRLLAQAALVAQDEGKLRAFHYSAFRARWAEARDIADPAVVKSLLQNAGLDGERALERTRSDELRQRIDAASHAAIERGVFGAPTLFVGDEMFWGNDRFEVARHYVQKAIG